MGEMYLNDADRNEVMRTVKRLREKLARKAQHLGLDGDAELWETEREYSRDWVSCALKSVDALKSTADPRPKADDHYNRWLPRQISDRLASVKKMKTLADLAGYINQRGSGWWKQVPQLGKQSADSIQGFFASSANDLGLTLDFSAPKTTSLTAVPVSNRIAPLDRFVPPLHLTGEAGTNRAPIERCRIDARNDYESIIAWLSLWGEDTSTHRAYRKEAERFLLWAIFEKGKALSSITTPDCAEYRRFLGNPQPVDRWIGKPAQRWSPEWRPFKGPLKGSSIRQAEVILSGLCEWLVGQRYLDSNPFSGLSTQGYGRKNTGTDRSLSPGLWERVTAIAESQANNPDRTESQRNDYRRTAFILKFAYQTGLRLHEMTKARIGDLKQVSSGDGNQWWLDVIGKGNKHREIPISPNLIESINTQLRHRKLGRIGYAPDDTPIIGKIRGESRAALSESGLYQKLKGFFEEAAKEIASEDLLAAEKLRRASTHWLRHSHGSHAVAGGVPLAIVRDNLGHSNIATTSIYVHTDRDERYKAMLGFNSKEKPPE